MGMDASHEGVDGREGIAFELVVFRRIGDEVEVTVRGMTTVAEVDLMVVDNDKRARIVAVGPCKQGPLREFELRTSVEVRPGKRLNVRGGSVVESVTASGLVDELPVVCTADPTARGLPAQFLHRRGGRYVLMSSADAPASIGSRRATMVA
jgi:hypothetical protein